jgi:hypothetical protein
MERAIGERLERLRAARAEAAAAGGPRRARSKGPSVDPMRVAGGVMPARRDRLARLAEAEERDAEGRHEDPRA